MATGLVVGGMLVAAGASMYSASQQRKAAKNAAAAAQKAASTATTSAAHSQGQTVSTEADAAKNAGEKAKRRLTVEDTVQRFANSGLRKTLN